MKMKLHISSLLLLSLLIVTSPPSSLAFLSSHQSRRSYSNSRDAVVLFGLTEWRDKVHHHDHHQRRFQDVNEQGNRLYSSPSSLFNVLDGTPKPILLLPFPASDALLPGQSMHLTLRDGRHLDLVQDVIDHFESIVGMSYMGDDGLENEITLCEIRNDDVEVTAGFRGRIAVGITLVAVGRAELIRLTSLQPIMKGRCTELHDDDTTVDVSFGSRLVDDIERAVKDLSRLENGKRKRRYDDAYESALDVDTQGYYVVTTNENETAADDVDAGVSGGGRRNIRSMRELTAASWAAVAVASSSPSSSDDDSSSSSIRRDAIAQNDLIGRLQLGLNALRDEKRRMSASSYFP